MARILKLGKLHYVAGMRWTSFEAIPKKSELREDAQRLRASWACVRVGDASIQAGFCHISKERTRQRFFGLYSLAAMVAETRRQPWQGTFNLGNGLWWYIAVRDGHAILPDGDVVGGEDVVLAARERHAGYSDWDSVDGDATMLLDMTEAAGIRRTPVRALHGAGILITRLLAGLLLACALMGGLLYWQHWREAERQRAMALARARQQISAPPSPLLTTPPPNRWLAACGAIISFLPLSSYGWSLDQISCLPASVNVHWVRGPGAVVASSLRPSGEVAASGDAVDQSLPLSLDTTGKDDAISLPEAAIQLRAWAQAAGFSLTVSPQTAAPGAPTVAAPAQLQQAAVSLDLPVSPFGMELPIPGLRLTKLATTPSGWHLEGVLYGK